MIGEASFISQAKAQERTLYRIAYSILHNNEDCLDAVQNALTNAWIHRAKVDEAGFRPWLTRIVINECHSLHRKKRRELPSVNIAQGAYHPPDPSLHDALNRLDAKYRLPILLYYMEGFNIAEIAKMLGLPAGTVKWRLSKARKHLKDELSDREGIERV